MQVAGVFKGILFKSPHPKTSIVSMILISFLFGTLSTIFQIFTFGLELPYSTLATSAFFILPSAIYGLLTNHIVENFYKRRAFLLAILNKTLIFFGIILSSLFQPFLLFLLGFSYTINVLSIAGISSRKNLIPLLFPLLYFVPIISALHLGEFFTFTVPMIALFISVGAANLSLIHLADYLFQLNLQTSALDLFSSFMNNKEKKLDFGTEINAPVQTLKLKNESGDYTISIPWLHPGPSKRMGGGSLSRSLTENLNKKEGEKGYFWHFPSSHEEDPCDPNIAYEILKENTSEISEYRSKATKLLKKSGESFEIFGQKFEDIYLIFLNLEEIDDFESEIFRNIRDYTDKKVIFVDMHHHEPSETGKILLREEEKAEKISQEIINLLEDLEKENEHSMKLGMDISESMDHMVLVLEVKDERYLFLTLDRNGIPAELDKKLETYREDLRFDETLLLTTDTHESFKFLDKNEEIDIPSSDLITKVLESVSEGEVGLHESTIKDVKVLGKKSYHFESTVVLTMHVLPILMALIHLIYFLAII